MKTEISALVYRIVRCTVPLLILLTVLLGSCGSEGMRLTIENKGRVSLDSVTVHVTGNEYGLGRIRPGETHTTEISVTGESHIELSHAGNRRLLLDVYLEPGYEGTIAAQVTPDSVLSVTQNTTVGP